MELKAWLDKEKVKIAGPPIGLFYDNPEETPRENLRSDACFPIDGKILSTGRFQVQELPAAYVAVTRHDGPPEEYTKTYGSFLENLLDQGYVLDGPAREIFEEPRFYLSPGKGIRIEQPVIKDQPGPMPE
jgi:DNA gyrase inhibitor GyrI